MNKYEKYLSGKEFINKFDLYLFSQNENEINEYIKKLNYENKKWLYLKLRNELLTYKNNNINIFLNQLNQIKNNQETKGKKELEEINNSSLYYLNLEEAKKINKEDEWFKILKKVLRYSYKMIKIPRESKIDLYGLLIKSEGFNDNNIIPILFLFFVEEYENTPFDEIVKSLKNKIKQRKTRKL